MKKKILSPLFVGLNHLGQVFSIGWMHKFKSAFVFDFDKKNYKNFFDGNLTQEEPLLKKFFSNYQKKFIHLKKEDISKFKNVFFTVDAPIDKRIINFKIIKEKIKELKSYLGNNVNLIICSQVYVGFCDEIQKEIFNDRKDVNIIYFVETVIMGEALNRFLNPERIIIGIKKKSKFIDVLKKFKCPILIYNYKQAEMVKVAINLYLATNVTFANTIDEYCRQYGFKFSSINLALKYDSRIGLKSYLNPSPGLSGGHLERDLKFLISTCKNKQTLLFFKKIFSYQKKRIDVVFKSIQSVEKFFPYKRIIWLGISYKKNSLSLLNSPFANCIKKFIKKKKIFLFYDSYFFLKNKISKHAVDINFIKKNNRENLFILNYLDNKDYLSIRSILKDKRNYILNINSNNNFKLTNNINNLF
jgi:nucleotide sugar dehydrogenase